MRQPMWTKTHSIQQLQRLVKAVIKERDRLPHNHIFRKRIEAELLEAQVFLKMAIKALEEGS
jgi:hypothetical protein